VEGQNMINESVLLESKSLRDSVLDRTDVLGSYSITEKNWWPTAAHTACG
jgi:hypothetical protein